jgi:hypothetical protein
MKIEQLINLKFLVKSKKKKTPTEFFQLLTEVYGDHVMSRTRVFECQKRFMESREEVEDNKHPGRPSTSKTEKNVEKISEIVRKDRV